MEKFYFRVVTKGNGKLFWGHEDGYGMRKLIKFSMSSHALQMEGRKGWRHLFQDTKDAQNVRML